MGSRILAPKVYFHTAHPMLEHIFRKKKKSPSTPRSRVVKTWKTSGSRVAIPTSSRRRSSGTRLERRLHGGIKKLPFAGETAVPQLLRSRTTILCSGESKDANLTRTEEEEGLCSITGCGGKDVGFGVRCFSLTSLETDEGGYGKGNEFN